MSELDDPLTLTLADLIDFGQLKGCPEVDSRTLFYNLIQGSNQATLLQTAYTFIQKQLGSVAAPLVNLHQSFNPDTCHQAFNALVINLPILPLRHYALALSPVIFTELAWLDNSLQACTNQNPLAMALWALSCKLHQGIPSKSITQSSLLNDGAPLPAIHTWAFAQQTAIPNALFDFATLQLALGKFPRSFFAEILGFTYAYCQTAGLLAQFDTDTFEPALQDRQLLLKAQLPIVLNLIQGYLASFPNLQTELWRRIMNGYCLYFQQADICCQHLHVKLTHPVSTHEALVELLERLRPQAVGHHAAIRIGNKALDAWFAESPFDHSGFLQALRQSPYIDQQQPANSRFLRLFEFNSPMFGVLKTHELALLKHWLCTPSNTKAIDLKTTPNDTPIDSTKPVLATTPYTPPSPLPKRNNREWYYTLVNIDLFPSALEAAQQRVQRLLYFTRLCNRLPFKHYRHEAFEAYIQACYQREVNAYQPLTAPPSLSKAIYLWGIEQLAPAILTDGCWLQNIQALKYQPIQAVGVLLTHIYTDELGDSVLAQNHPYLYQQLLHDIGLTLPPIHTRAFSQHPGFMDSAFDIPNYLLAIAQFPTVFLPELLGLNMAIELSGLGKDYLRLAQALKYYHLDPTIVNVHISIDNLATGHAALAKQAIQRYLDEVLACAGAAAMHQHWRRIYTGYCSLAFASRRFTVALVGHGLYKWLVSPLMRIAKPHLTAPTV